MEKKELKKYLILATIVVIICFIVKYIAFVGQFILIVISAMTPLIFGVAIAFIFDIFLSFCEKYYFPKHNGKFISSTRRPVCLVLSIALMATLIALLIKIIVPELSGAVRVMSDEIPKAAMELKEFAVKELNDYPSIQSAISKIEIDWDSAAKEIMNFVKVGASGFISSVADIIGTVAVSVYNVVIAIIFSIYLLIRKEKLKTDIRRMRDAYLSENASRSLTHLFKTANLTFKNFFVGQFTEAIILGMLCMIGMSILKLPYAAMTGAVVGVMALLPIVGAYVGAAVGAFMICTVDPMKAVIFLIFLVLLQQFEGNVIYPKVVGNSVGLPGIWVLAAVVVGGGLFGILGMLLGVPTLATIYKIYHEKLSEREKKLGLVYNDENDDKKGTDTDNKKNQEKGKKKKDKEFKFPEIFKHIKKD